MIDSEKFEQMELDTRPQLVAAIEDLTSSSIRDAQGMIEENRRRIAAMMQTTPATVRNRHEAYGIAAEQYARIAKAVSSIKGDTATLLGTLADPNFPAVEATSSIVNSTTAAATVLIWAAAEMRRPLDNLYMAEMEGSDQPTPLEELAGVPNFQEAEAVDDGEEMEE